MRISLEIRLSGGYDILVAIGSHWNVFLQHTNRFHDGLMMLPYTRDVKCIVSHQVMRATSLQRIVLFPAGCSSILFIVKRREH